MILSSIKRIVANFALVLSILGLGILFVFHSVMNTILPEMIFYLLMLFFLILFFCLLLYRFAPQDKGRPTKLSDLKIGRLWSCLLMSFTIGLYFLALVFDLFILHAMYYSTIMLMVGIFISILLTRYSYRSALSFILFVFLMYLFIIYAFYPPSLGIDTVRDVESAFVTVRQGSIGGMTNSAYQIPIVPVTYSMLSITLGIAPIYASVIMGALYIFTTAVLAFLISKKIDNKINTLSSFLVVILVLSIPLVSFWSVALIPQAYAFVSFLVLLLVAFRNTTSKLADILLVLPIILVIALTHAGSTLWTIGFLASMTFAMRFNSRKHNDAYFFIKWSLLVLSLVTIVYFAYTVVLSHITDGIQNVIIALFNAITLTQESSYSTISVSNPFATALFCYGPLIVTVALSVISWLTNNHSRHLNGVFKETAFAYGILMLAMGLMGTIFFSNACLDRYLGFGSLLLLSIISVTGFDFLIRRGYICKLFAGGLIAISIISLGFGGVLNPSFNPFNIQNSYSTPSLPNWSEFTGIASVVSLIDNGIILTDQRTGLMIPDLYLNFNEVVELESRWQNYYINTPAGDVVVRRLGSYGLVADYAYITNYIDEGGFFFYRAGSLNKTNVLVNISESNLINSLSYQYNFIYNGKIVVINSPYYLVGI